SPRQARGGSSFLVLGASNLDFSRILLVGFPIGDLVLDPRVIGSGLDAALGIDGAGDDRVLARLRVLPIKSPEGPSVLLLIRKFCGRPRAIIDLDFDCFERCSVAPRRSGDG